MWCGRLDALRNAAELLHKRQTSGAQRVAEGLAVEVAGGDDRHAEHICQHLGNMQGAVAFARTHIDVDAIERQVQTVEDHCAQDGTVHPGDAGGGLVHGRASVRLVEIDDLVAATVEFGNHRERRHADNANQSGHHTSSRNSKI